MPAYPVPTSLSPSRVESFTSCPMAFRFASIERIPEPPAVHTTLGSFVHRVLELLFTRPTTERTRDTAGEAAERARREFATDPEYTMLHLDAAGEADFHRRAAQLVDHYFEMEDPTTVRDIGLELRLEAPVGDLRLRGIIDRLELAPDGSLVVTDYKTGRPPAERHAQSRMTGVQFYSFLCEAVLGRRPSLVRLMYLATGDVLSAEPSERTVRFVTSRTEAVWRAIERACETGDFRPRTGPLCDYCSFKPWCPAFGGDPSLAATEAPERFGFVT